MHAMTQTPQLQTALVANNLPIPSALGSLEAYIGAVNRVPVLTVEDEQALAHRFHDEEDLGEYNGFPVYRDASGKADQIYVAAVKDGPIAPYKR